MRKQIITMYTLLKRVFIFLLIPLPLFGQAVLGGKTTVGGRAVLGASYAATPNLVQMLTTPNTGNGGQNLVAGGNAKFSLGRAAQTGNAIIVVWWTSSTSGTNTLTDNTGSNTWTAGPACTDTNSAQRMQSAIAVNVAANTRVFTLTVTSASAWFGAMVMEVQNVTAIHSIGTSNCPNNSMTTITSGSITPANGDFLALFFANTNASVATSIAAGSQSHITWKTASEDDPDGMGSQWGVYTASTAINPTMSQGSTGADTMALSVALTSGTQGGGIPAGVEIFGEHYASIQGGNANPYTVQMHVYGNEVVGMIDSQAGTQVNSISGMTCSISSSTQDAGAIVATQDFHCDNLTSGEFTLTITQNNTTGVLGILFYDIGGATASPIDNTWTNTSNSQTGTGNFNSVTTGTLANANELVLANCTIAFNTVTSTTTSGALLDNGFLSTNNVSNTDYYNNDGNAHYLASGSTAAVTFGWGVQSGLGPNVANWASTAIGIE